MRAIRRFTVRVTLPEPLEPLHDLMLNLRWSWHPGTVELFESIDRAAWAASAPLRRHAAALLTTPSPSALDECERCEGGGAVSGRACAACEGVGMVLVE